jgi:lipopolysaccharide transport system ATP-binding protein
MADPALQAVGLTKEFRHRTADQPRTFRAWVEGGLRRSGPKGTIRALDDVSFSVAPGEMLGVIGRNGSGKSTLMRLLGGVMEPDEGRVVVASTPNGLLELNAGMHPDLTGRENILIAGVLAGLLRSEVMERAEAIVAFAELQDHIDDPVRTYSAGMRLRLGFAVAVHVDPRILLIDEVLSVGDLAFQQKCLDRIQEFKARGCAIVLISHDLHQVASSCDRVLWLDRGVVRALGRPEDVVAAYTGAVSEETRRRTDQSRPEREASSGVTLRPGENWLGSQEASIADVAILDAGGRPVRSIEPGGSLTVRLRIATPEPLRGAPLFCSINDANGTTLVDVNTDNDRVDLPALVQGSAVMVGFDRLDLAPGEYRISVGLWAPGWAYAYDTHLNAYPLTVTGSRPSWNAPLAPPRRWSVQA